MTPLAALLLAAATTQTPRLREGDRWSLDRTVHYVSVANGIDFQNDDHLEFRLVRSDGKLLMKVSQIQTGTHLPGGVIIPSPKGEPQKWTFPISSDGSLALGAQPKEPFERTLAEILVAVLNGQAPAEDSKLITIKWPAPDQERVTYDGTAIQSATKLEGDVTFDPVTHAPVSISLLGQNIPIPGGDLRASVKVEYKVPPHVS